jgi:malate synthase
VRKNIDVALRYLEFWLHGNGCVPIYGLMEDAATAEICGAQLSQWIRYGARLYDGAESYPQNWITRCGPTS